MVFQVWKLGESFSFPASEDQPPGDEGGVDSANIGMRDEGVQPDDDSPPIKEQVTDVEREVVLLFASVGPD